MSLPRRAAALLGVGVLLAVPAATASTQPAPFLTTFRDRTAFTAATGGVIAQDFQIYCDPTVARLPIPCSSAPALFTTIVGNGLDVRYTPAQTTDVGFAFAEPGTARPTGLSLRPQSVVLTAEGNERFEITPSSARTVPAFGIGFDVYTNGLPGAVGPFLAPIIEVFDTGAGGGTRIGRFDLNALGFGRNQFGFFGVQSSVAIGRVTYEAIDGLNSDTAIDNLFVGDVAAAAPADPTAVVPEPATVTLAAGGLLALAAAARRRGRTA